MSWETVAQWLWTILLIPVTSTWIKADKSVPREEIDRRMAELKNNSDQSIEKCHRELREDIHSLDQTIKEARKELREDISKVAEMIRNGK